VTTPSPSASTAPSHSDLPPLHWQRIGVLDEGIFSHIGILVVEPALVGSADASGVQVIRHLAKFIADRS
jgi:hypothetical protein